MVELIIILACLFINALLSAFEMAFVTVRKTDLKIMSDKGDVKAANVLLLRKKTERTLSVIQIGITLVGAVAAAVGGAGASDSIEPYLIKNYGFSETIAEATGILFVVLPLTYLSVVAGELVPKTIALRNPVIIARLGAKGIIIADKILSIPVTLLEWSTKTFLKIIYPKSKKTDQPSIEPVDIGLLSPVNQQFVLNMVNIESKKVKDIFVPWAKVSYINYNDSIEDVTTAVLMLGHTRLPVVRDGNVMGLLHTKEFMSLKDSGEEHWIKIVRPCIFVGADQSAIGALRIMQTQHYHMAVVGEYDAPAGVVTLEDIIEEIVGEIYDEDDDQRVSKLFASRAKNKKPRSK